MNRKWLAGLTVCILLAGLTFLRAQSPAPSQPQAPAADDPPQGEWIADEPFDVFTAPGPELYLQSVEIDPAAGPGLPFPDPAAGDVFFLSNDGASANMAFAGPPEFPAALPFPPEPQGGAIASGVSFVGPDPQDTITFVGFEAGLGNQVLAGAPYSAQITSEFVQTLPDGNKIERKATTNVYRDGQGRTRREQTLPAIGQYSVSTTAPQAIFITDPVAGVTYVLDPARKIARKMTRPNAQFFQANPGGPGRGAVAAGPGPGGPGGPGGAGRGPRPERRPDPNVTTESLGSRNIEGLLVEGTRVVRTIPAGAVGNQNPIQVTSERWYSPDLKLNLLVKNIDPMRGTNSTALSNIRRDEPAASLFQVPSDYTVQEPPNRPRQLQRRPGAPPPPPQQ
jgi:hypothetical protein